jgi:hypothetical protein
VASIRPAGLGAGDLFYSTYVGGLTGKRTLFVSLALDELGDAIVGGETTSSSYPQERPLPCPASGLREGAITYLPLLAGGVFRDELSRANPACAAPLHTGAGGAPVPGATFTITACDAPPNTAGFLVLGGPLTPTPLPSPFNGWQLVGLAALQLVFTDGNGCASFALPVPAGAPPVPNWGLAAQWFALTTPACPGSGVLANSERLSF